MFAKFLGGIIAFSYVERDRRSRHFLSLKEQTFDIEKIEGVPGRWSAFLRPMTRTYYETYSNMIWHTAARDRDHAPMYDNFKRTCGQGQESFGLHQKSAKALQAY